MSDSENIQGTENADDITTGSGNDNIAVGGGNDAVQAGLGDDYVTGGSGQDTLVGDTIDDISFNPRSLNIVEDYSMSLTFASEGAGYRNTIGTYKIDPDTGRITDVQVVWENASLQGSGGNLQAGQSTVNIDATAGSDVGFFLIANGFSQNDFANLGEGAFQFVTPNGAIGGINDATPPQLQFVSEDGTVTDLNGNVYHATATGADTASNADGITHALGHSSADGTLQLGFEDLHGGGDLDFDDSVFTIDIGPRNLAATIEANNVESTADGGDDRLEGRTGEDFLVGHGGNDLLVGGGAGSEWELVDGEWVYHADRVNPDRVDPYMVADGSDDVIIGGVGGDVLLGNAGNDDMYGGSGSDRINGGTGNDRGFGGTGRDKINLEDGNDYSEGGFGADTINAGDGDDLIYGDNAQDNLLRTGGDSLSSISQFVESGAWNGSSDPETDAPIMSQRVETEAGETYSFSLDIAANLPAGASAGTVDVLWNGEVIETLTTTTGTFQSHTISINGTGEIGELSLRNSPFENDGSIDMGPKINMDTPIFSYEKTITIEGQDTDVAAFAPGQAKLYQVITGQLKVFDPKTSEYVDAGAPAAVKVNAIGFNVQDDLIYGIAKSNGVDALGNAITTKDLVTMDAEGNTYRIGKTPVGDYVGDFDDSGNLWTFQSSVNRITKIDVDNLDANGNPVATNYYLPNDFLQGNTYDIAFNANDQSFYAVQAPSTQGGNGILHKIDVSNFDGGGGTPELTSIPISGTLFEGEMLNGMPKGAYGAVFMDGEGNLYAGLNRGDHDLDGATSSKGAIYKINYDFDTGSAYAEFKAESQITGSNDGAVDPRSIDPFTEVDPTASVQIRNIELTEAEGGDDKLRGGDGNDEIYGNAGNDTLQGGTGDDTLSGDQGDDKVFGGAGDDSMFGGEGNDTLKGGDGHDTMDGGAGNDYLAGKAGDDSISGGAGNDKLSGGTGNDSLQGDSGSDTLWGGEGDDWAFGGTDNDTIDLGLGNDTALGGAGEDRIKGRDGDDSLDGGAGNDHVIGGEGSDIISGGAGNDHLWGGQWSGDGASDTFVYCHGGGRDSIHDFEVAHDRIDLSAYGLSYDDIQDRIIDRGWATEINLQGVDKSGAGDKILLKSINPDDLDESNFIL